MKQVRLSIGCRDWQQIIEAIGPEAAGVLVYLRTLMRSMQASEISVTLQELAEALRMPQDRAEKALETISARYLERVDTGGVITLRSPEEAKAAAERFRKRVNRLNKTNKTDRTDSTNKKPFGNSGEAAEFPKNELNKYETDFFMVPVHWRSAAPPGYRYGPTPPRRYLRR